MIFASHALRASRAAVIDAGAAREGAGRKGDRRRARVVARTARRVGGGRGAAVEARIREVAEEGRGEGVRAMWGTNAADDGRELRWTTIADG